MNKKTIYIGNNEFISDDSLVSGNIVNIENQDCYKISNYNHLKPFFMNIVSNSDLWMFLSSKGSLTSGRRNSDNSIFPYYTEDKIHDFGGKIGPKTFILVEMDNKTSLWEPFKVSQEVVYNLERNIYKNILGNYIFFEEKNLDLNLTFRYSWSTCDKYGFVRKSTIVNNNSGYVKVDLVDGLQNLLPAELNRRLQSEYSNLVDAYKKGELLTDNKIAAYTLSSIPTDKAEPNESLLANTVWCTGLESYKVLLSSSQLGKFKLGYDIEEESIIRGQRSSFLVNTQFHLKPNDERSWYILADVNKSQSDFISLSNEISNNRSIIVEILKQVEKDNELLHHKIARNDGIQLVNDRLNSFRHTSNVLFNILRGGIFVNNYQVSKNDFIEFVRNANKRVYQKYQHQIESMDDEFRFDHILKSSEKIDQDLERLVYEYLPITFSRRHGDPSRPWNQFSIDVRDENGKPKLDYQGNWRDIFQNWEALAISYPEYIEKMIVKFLNASTADGYNPYRVFRDGFEWEIIEPDDEWSFIGYWGDHQIIYLLKLLEISHKYNPDKLSSLFDTEIFTYANIPYKIKTYQEILNDPQNTIDFDFEQDEKIMSRVDQMGFDGKFLYYQNDNIVYTGLAEKLLVPLLVKLSNFVPGAGIWMNTQRPEWNDANNALVGYGVSMVTLNYLRRYVVFLSDLFSSVAIENFNLHNEVIEFFNGLNNYFSNHLDVLSRKITDKERKEFVDEVGRLGSDYRINLYRSGFKGRKEVLDKSEVVEFLTLVKRFLDNTILSNKRDDGLYHSYNLISISKTEIGIRRLYEMLEGQVAALSSGLLSTDESIRLLKSLKNSSLYREDQNSYILYPNRSLNGFLEKNVIDNSLIENNYVLKEFTHNNSNSILVKDENNNWHFTSQFKNSRILEEHLAVAKDHDQVTDLELDSLLELYEKVFDHQSFTGRSGTFFKFEGLGSIYWHMVSKLLLAVQETYFRAKEKEGKAELKSIYYQIKDGLGVHKNPALYGSFPTDPYSHTPESEGAQQPGMTGQVKEDIHSRFGELGVIVKNGKISFDLSLFDEDEFILESATFRYFNVENQKKFIKLESQSLGFTVCQVPIIYSKSSNNKIKIYRKDTVEEIPGLELNQDISNSIFQRNNTIQQIIVEINL